MSTNYKNYFLDIVKLTTVDEKKTRKKLRLEIIFFLDQN